VKRIVKINSKPKKSDRWGLYDVTFSDGHKQWNACLNQDSFRQQKCLEEIDDLTDDLPKGIQKNLFEKIEELEYLAYNRGMIDEAEYLTKKLLDFVTNL
jgi:hypothetical protein